MIKAARQNAEDTGVSHLIHLQQRAVKELSHPKNMGLSLPIRRMANGSRIKDHFRGYIGNLERGLQGLTVGRHM